MSSRSSSSSSDEDSDGDSDSECRKKQVSQNEASLPEINKWEGTSTNTGPKGVIKDWQRYKQLENEKRTENEREKIELMKKFTLTVQSALDEEREKVALEDPDFAELLNDEFLLNYQKQRMQEMLLQTNHNIKFGKVVVLKDSQDFLNAIDKENKSVTVVVHIYEENVEACCTMNACLKQLCKIYENVKFCAIVGCRAGMSQRFKADGVPAILIYKAGQLVGNFIRLSDDLGNDFQPEDVQSFLVEHGMLEDKSCTPLLIKDSHNESDSD
ncbi:phosducin-like protein [Asbolus verrucosus]|uniref:Phosducin-like protein n=1 Tax=Asbolus verrucosus TaxID=1661398 RepID=A0A482VAM1_ASBVE|nr:phosducin-like protein [Asbolus verrucosus]